MGRKILRGMSSEIGKKTQKGNSEKGSRWRKKGLKHSYKTGAERQKVSKGGNHSLFERAHPRGSVGIPAHERNKNPPERNNQGRKISSLPQKIPNPRNPRSRRKGELEEGSTQVTEGESLPKKSLTPSLQRKVKAAGGESP